MALLGAAVPTSSQAHHPPTGTVSDHLEEDYVFHSRAKERRLERRTARITAPDVAVAQRRAPDDPDQVGQWGPVVDWPVVGVHVALLTNGKVVAYDSVGDARPSLSRPQLHAGHGLGPADRHPDGGDGDDRVQHLLQRPRAPDGRNPVRGRWQQELVAWTGSARRTSSTSPTTRGAAAPTCRWSAGIRQSRRFKDGEMLITEGGPDVPEVRQNERDHPQAHQRLARPAALPVDGRRARRQGVLLRSGQQDGEPEPQRHGRMADARSA